MKYSYVRFECYLARLGVIFFNFSLPAKKMVTLHFNGFRPSFLNPFFAYLSFISKLGRVNEKGRRTGLQVPVGHTIHPTMFSYIYNFGSIAVYRLAKITFQRILRGSGGGEFWLMGRPIGNLPKPMWIFLNSQYYEF